MRRSVWFKLGAVGGGLILALGLATAMVVGLELYAESKIRDGGGWNRWGYRGRALGRKAPNEIRVAAIGGSTTYGFTVRNAETYPSQLEAILNELLRSRGLVVSVVNLGHLADSSVCYVPTYRDYGYLEPDLVILYEGYNDVGRSRRPTANDCYRRTSAIYRWTGLFPASPIFIRERWYKLRYGSIAAGYQALRDEGRTPPGGATAGRMDSETNPGRLEEAYRRYEANVLAFTAVVLADGKGLVFASQPYLGQAAHLDQQTRVRAALASYRGHPRFRDRDFLYLFGGRWDPHWFNEAMWLNPRGNRRLAEKLAEPLLELIESDPALLGRAQPVGS